MTRRTLSGLAVLVTLVAAATSMLPAQETPAPTLMQALTVRLDFEEDINGDHFPDDMTQIQGRRHPENIRAGRDTTESHDGKCSFRIELDGITNIYETIRTYRFDPRFTYRLSGYIRTQDVPSEGLRATSARIEFVGIAPDQRTAVYTQSTRPLTGTHDWTKVALDIPRDVTRMFRLFRIRCVIDGLALDGKVWFDEISLVPCSPIRALVGSPDGFLSPDDKPKAGISLDTLIERDYELSAKLLGPFGDVLMERAAAVTPEMGFVADAEFDLPLGPFGLYRFETTLKSAGREVSSSSRTFVYWPHAASDRSIGTWGIYTGGLGRLDDRWTQMLLESRLGTIGYDLFADGTAGDNATLRGHRAAPRLARLRQQTAEPVAVLGHVPAGIVSRLFGQKQVLSTTQATWPRALSLEARYWSQELDAAARPVASRTTCWQIGDVPDHSLSGGELTRAVRQLRAALAPITYRQRIGLVFDGSESDEVLAAAKECDFVVLRCPSAAHAETELPRMVQRLRSGVKEVWVSASVSGSSPVEEVVEQMVRARAAGADRVNLHFAPGAFLDINGDPTPVTAAVATVVREVGDKEFLGTLSTHTKSFVFSGPGGSRLVVLPSAGGRGDVLYLGRDLRRIDLEGNVRPITTADGRVLLEGAGRASLIDGLDVAAIQTRLSLRLAPKDATVSDVRSDLRPQTLTLEVSSGFGVPLIGAVEITPPEGWKLEHERMPVRLEPGRPTRIDTRVEVPVTESAGEHVFMVRLRAGETEMSIPRSVTLGLRDIDTNVVVQRDDDGYTVRQKITNHDERPARLALFVLSADTGRIEQHANGIAPGASTEISFKVGKVTSRDLWVGWREISGTRFFNRYLTLADADR